MLLLVGDLCRPSLGSRFRCGILVLSDCTKLGYHVVAIRREQLGGARASVDGWVYGSELTVDGEAES
jgi:hypothetical protein